ncbi:MFS transporter [Fictibacillus barbaricus]|uniref:MFS family permease n=1 Tax=Fictibacillus barbaricus TaxID=182136 RepID=A0ABU1TWY4_9BACL|nr:MFS transporter [Fictibacillus barbaricus]MDR7071731.1 MFS family permease [Fictibacillus barbaricus]
MKVFADIFKNRAFTRLFIGNTISQLGSVIAGTSFMLYLLDRFSDQPAYASVVELMYALPMLAVFLLIGVFADRLDRQMIVTNCNWINGIICFLMLGTIYMDWIYVTFGLLFIGTAINKFFNPAMYGLIQGILKEDEYATSSGLTQMVQAVFMLFGNLISVYLYWLFGIYGAIMIDAVTYLAAALLIFSSSMPEKARIPNGLHRLRDLKIKMVWNDYKLGFKYITGYKLLLFMIAGASMFGIVNGGFSVMWVFILKYKLTPETYEQMLIYLGIVFGVAVMFGSFIGTLISGKIKSHILATLGIFLMGISICIIALSSNVLSFFIYCAICGMFLPLANIGFGGWMPRVVDKKMMGRVQGWINPVQMLLQSLTLLFIAMFYPKLFSIETLYYLVGGVMIIVGLFYAVTIPALVKKDEEKRAAMEASEKIPATS